MEEFFDFLKEMNITNIIISMIISQSLHGLIQVIINQFVTKIVEKYLIDTDVKVNYFGEELDLGVIIDKTVMFIVSLLFAFALFKYLDPIF